jgi:hypothetical protein
MLLTRLFSTAIIVAVAAKFALPVGQPLGFRTEINRLNSVDAPYTGALVFKLNQNGILNGLYESDSIRPDPFYGQQIPVTGTLSGNNIRVQIGTGAGAVVINGTTNGHGITGSATMRGGVWTFKAERVHLHNPPAKT